MMKILAINARLKSSNGTPVLPSVRQYEDPTKQGARRRRAFAELNRKLSAIRSDLKLLIEKRIEPLATRKASNIFANAQYQYTLNPSVMAEINTAINAILRGQYIGGAENFNESFWLYDYIRTAYQNGAQDIANTANNITASVGSAELTRQLNEYTGSTLYRAGQLGRAAILGARVFENMKGLTDQTRTDLASTLFQGMEQGLGTIELTKNVMERVGVSGSRATRIVRTEIGQAYRQATRRETDILNDEVYDDSDFEMRMLWFSALTATTRRTHGRRHGRTYTTEEVDSFYSKNANAINCYCSQTAVLVDKDTGEVFQDDLVKQMEAQRSHWFKEEEQDAEQDAEKEAA